MSDFGRGGQGRGRGRGRGGHVATQAPARGLATQPGEDGTPGKRARQLPPGETNFPGVDGPLDVRGRCWKCLRLVQHKAKDCNQPHPEFNANESWEAIRKLSHGLIVCP